MGETAVLHSDSGWPRLRPGGDWRRPPLPQSLVLAVLLHVLLVALVGTVPGHGLPQGDPAWGALRIRLEAARGSDERGQAERVRSTPAPGVAPAPRYGGPAPQAPPLPTPDPGAPDIGPRGPQAVSGLQSEPAAPAPHSIDNVAPAPPPPVLERAPAPAPMRVTAPDARESAPRQSVVEAAPAADERPSSTAPRLAPLATVEAPALRRPVQAAADIAAPDVQAAAPTRPAATSLHEDTDLPPARATAADAQALAPVPAVPAPAVQEPAPLLDAGTQPVAPRPPDPEPAWPAAAPRSPPAPTLAPFDAQSLPAQGPIASPRLLVPPLAVGVAGAGGAQPGAAVTRPQASAERVDAAPPAARGPTRLNLELPGARAPSAGLASPRLLNLVPPPPERKSPLAQGIEKAARPDCRKAYSGMGALAAVPLTVDALREGGCRW